MQIAKQIYVDMMAAMKELLSNEERRIGSREDPNYKYYKKLVMDKFYTSMINSFSELEKAGILEKCSCGTNIRNGYKKCEFCSGSGWRNKNG